MQEEVNGKTIHYSSFDALSSSCGLKMTRRVNGIWMKQPIRTGLQYIHRRARRGRRVNFYIVLLAAKLGAWLKKMILLPQDFMFESTKNELERWRRQFGTSKGETKGLRYKPKKKIGYIKEGQDQYGKRGYKN